jgi:hypothetical protein
MLIEHENITCIKVLGLIGGLKPTNVLHAIASAHQQYTYIYQSPSIYPQQRQFHVAFNKILQFIY